MSDWLTDDGLPQSDSRMRVVLAGETIDGTVTDGWLGDEPGFRLTLSDGTERAVSLTEISMFGPAPDATRR